MSRADLLPSAVVQNVQDLLWAPIKAGRLPTIDETIIAHDALGNLVEGLWALEALWRAEIALREYRLAEIEVEEPAQAGPAPAGALPPQGEALLVALQRSAALAAIVEEDGNVTRVAFGRPARQGIWHEGGDAA